MAGSRSFGAINVRQVPLGLREQFRALCALRGTAMTRRVIELIEQDVRRAHDDGEYLAVIARLEKEVPASGQRELWPEATRQE